MSTTPRPGSGLRHQQTGGPAGVRAILDLDRRRRAAPASARSRLDIGSRSSSRRRSRAARRARATASHRPRYRRRTSSRPGSTSTSSRKPACARRIGCGAGRRRTRGSRALLTSDASRSALEGHDLDGREAFGRVRRLELTLIAELHARAERRARRASSRRESPRGRAGVRSSTNIRATALTCASSMLVSIDRQRTGRPWLTRWRSLARATDAKHRCCRERFATRRRRSERSSPAGDRRASRQQCPGSAARSRARRRTRPRCSCRRQEGP